MNPREKLREMSEEAFDDLLWDGSEKTLIALLPDVSEAELDAIPEAELLRGALLERELGLRILARMTREELDPS